ncbi:ROK family transcriptional regulator [Acidaminobacter sp. JC074]|uniref:ROK family transcriptional regulator n=1 Tax=Acidaminobacter sp. JC074 TaxID=2530199 RepID=UPI001F0EAD01|nr:ROK family transcriptional regulator [Acidaminobacter sp. JC074]MCH4889250.1 ROK family transcriptional regulator [Acidaminobacter sp. JC074]
MDTSVLKRINKNKIRTALRTCETASKNSLAQMTGLSVGTCNNMLKELIEEGEVLELDHAPSTGGRRSRVFRYNMNYAYLMSLYTRIEDNVESIYYQVTDLSGNIKEEAHREYDFITLKDIQVLVETMLSLYPQLKLVSLGVPGVVQNGQIKNCDIKKLADTHPKMILEDHFKLGVVVENDVNASAIGYYAKTDYDDESFAYIYYPLNGFAGAGFIVHNQILRGFSSFSGEMNHMPFESFVPSHEEGFLNQVAKALISIVCILNPNHIVLSGLGFTDLDLEIIEAKLQAHLPGMHVPELMCESDFHDSYIYGLRELALDHYNKMI